MGGKWAIAIYSIERAMGSLLMIGGEICCLELASREEATYTCNGGDVQGTVSLTVA